MLIFDRGLAVDGDSSPILFVLSSIFMVLARSFDPGRDERPAEDADGSGEEGLENCFSPVVGTRIISLTGTGGGAC